MKSKVFFLTFQKHLTKFGNVISYLNWKIGISGKLHKLLHEFLVNRKQKVVLNGEVSSSGNVEAGVPQDSILGPLLFLIYINDLPRSLIRR